MSYQTKMPESGEEIAIIKTNFGDITVKFFKEEAPKATENFITHAKNGYYNDISFHRVIKDFMIQGGDPEGTGRGGKSIWGDTFEDEFDVKLHNIKGALSMANAGPNTNGSQFFIVQAKTVPDGMIEQMAEYPESYPNESVDDYKALGGTPWLDYKHTVFGQVIDGMDTVDTIAALSVDENSKPIDEAWIECILFEDYKD